MRIQIEIDPSVIKRPLPAASAPPLVQIGGEMVIMELQGDLTFEGEPGGKVIGLLGLERMDKPTLHLGKHHLLHGKIVNLPRPLAVIRRADERDIPPSDTSDMLTGIEGSSSRHGKDVAEEEDAPELEEETQQQPGPLAKRSRPNPGRRTTTTTTTNASSNTNISLDPFQTSSSTNTPTTPPQKTTTLPAPASSSPPGPSTTKNRDYSSDLSSPVRPFIGRSAKRKPPPGGRLGTVDEREPVEDGEVDIDVDVDAEGGVDMEVNEVKSASKKVEGDGPAKSRTREYKVVGVVRKKVVFALRPEPIVTATVLPE